MDLTQQTSYKYPVYTAQEAQWFDTNAISNGISGFSLMQKAGLKAWRYIEKKLTSRMDIHVFCGSGNNGGDGWIFAMEAHKAGHKVHVWHKQALSESAQQAYKKAAAILFLDRITELNSNSYSKLECLVQFSQQNPVLIVDSLFGIGLNRPLNDEFCQIIAAMNQVNGYKYALDIPSGINATTGFQEVTAFQAQDTITFIVEKQGLFRNEGKACSGTVHLEPLDLDVSPCMLEESTLKKSYRVYRDQPSPDALTRPEYGHKGSFGTLFCVGGDQGMGGAIIIAAESAIRFGAGKVFIASHDFHNTIAITRCPSLMSSSLNHIETDASSFQEQLEQANSLVLGPGLGQSHWSLECFKACFNSAFNGHIILDADALNLISHHDEAYKVFMERDLNAIITPHPKEADRLLGRLFKESELKILSPFDKAIALSKHYKCICVLKGHGTIIASEDTAFISETGNSALAKAGQGDCLSGMIGALLAQNLPLIDAARLAVWAHGLAGEFWSQTESKLSLMPHETAQIAAKALKEKRQEIHHASATY